jgi:hypothetical protein
MKAQSAMEYLMTYGWSILIIAVVLGTLYSLNVFGSANYAPHAAPGSCKVFRPNGPGTNQNLNLVGVCNTQPQFISQFNGQTSSINIGNPNLGNGANAITLSAWFTLYATPNSRIFFSAVDAGSTGFDLESFGDGNIGVSGRSYGTDAYQSCRISAPSLGRWHYMAGIMDYANKKMYVYLDGGAPAVCNAAFSSNSYAIGNPNMPLYIGSYGNSQFVNGLISNVQVYNASMDANQIKSLYQEGIGGAPITLQNLIGWWPLNGDARDYSGNNNNGVPTNVAFTTSYSFP